jgi:GTP cyclohydrolase I
MKVLVPVTSLCPCSKNISEYGAHNQRSHVTLSATLRDELPVESLIGIAEQAAYTVESENFESIHNHSAYALIERVKP